MESDKRRGMGDFIVRKPRPLQPTPSTQEITQPTKPISHEAEPVEPIPAQAAKQIKKRWKKLRLWWLDIWQPLIIILGVGLIVTSVMGFRIGSLTKGASPAEKAYIQSVDSGRELLEHPTFMPHKLPTYGLFKIGVKRVGAYRAISAVFAVGTLITGFLLLRRWYSLRIAIMGSWLLLSSAWLLHGARLALPTASFLLLMPLLWTAVWMYNTKRQQFALALLLFISIFCFYIPGFCWLVLGAVVWQRKTVWQEFVQTKWWFKALLGFGGVLLAAPLLYAAILDPRELLLLAGLPDYLPRLPTLAANVVEVPQQLFLRGPQEASSWLGRLPLLDVFSTVMLALGLYSLRYNIRLIRAQLLLATGFILTLLIITGGLVSMLALLPIVYILIAAGMAFMLQQWFTVFPRNPVARGLATTLMSIVILLVSFYHISHYFIAWPQTPATKQAFGQSLVK